MKISIINSQKIAKLNLDHIRHIAKNVLTLLGEKKAELSVYIVDDAEIKRLNLHYRDIDKSTDVLAFSMREGETIKGSEGILGDVVISAQTAARHSHGYVKKIKEEIDLYLVHGILHLVGYGDNSIRARKKMQDLQNKLIREIRLNS